MTDLTRKVWFKEYKFLRNVCKVSRTVIWFILIVSLRKIVTHLLIFCYIKNIRRERERFRDHWMNFRKIPNLRASGRQRRCRQFSRYVINVGDTMCREFVTASAIARDTLPRSSRTTSLRCCTPIRGKLIVTISLSGAHPPSHKGDASSAVPRRAAILPSPS